ncbi:flagellar hook-associated protein FlgL [Neobacillus sp. MM2021_6]|uniref:flagellar hook-associated protein FlgL n=1 Tax=Bacillaceae TaxID=186817 RepID=UPI00140DE32E|nr:MULTISPECIES: flagellar hook-associated protein FlgL [Bacillaceae]MBO0961052.1 flagellar hook-associated protein FlgL [Neobacillus sp. MM2021_6]NHC21340.1 flagellar hook-associated protein FlgL [Bacillus sp. MM2020_4]
MSNRVTQGMLNQNFLYNLSKSNKALEKYQDQFSSGKKINKPSDDPVTAVRSMYYRSSLNEIDQFKRNASDGLSWMESGDSALDEVTTVLHRVRELTVEGLNGTNDESSKSAIAAEINQLKEHLGEIANTQIGGKYIFAGTDVNNPPYRVDPNVPNSPKEFRNDNGEKLELQVGHNNNVQINVLGKDIFNNDGQGGIFQVLSNIVDQFTSPDGQNDELLGKLDAQLDNILKERSELGARMNRMELSMSRIDGLELSTTKLLSNEEDADLSKVIIDLKAQENVQNAALAAGARIIQPSLVDFLR